MIVFRCDICKNEVRDFWNIAIVRKRCHGSEAPTQERAFSLDVCSAACEKAAIERILSLVAPVNVAQASPAKGNAHGPNSP